MRALPFLLIALLAAAPRAEAAQRGDSPGGQSAGRPTAARSVVARPAAAAPARVARQPGQVLRGRAVVASGRGVASIDSRQASARYLCPRGGQPVRGGRCRGAGAADVGGLGGGLRWQAGLPPADHSQRECPDGTLATLARGHADVVRCVPL